MIFYHSRIFLGEKKALQIVIDRTFSNVLIDLAFSEILKM